MKLVTFSTDSDASPHLGALDPSAERVLDLTAKGLPSEMVELIALGAPGLEKAAQLLGAAAPADWRPLGTVRLLAPIPRPRRNIFCVGKNYHSHAQEFHRSGFDGSAGANAIPERPIIFTKAPSAVIAPDETILGHLDETRTTDYEGELGVVIGTGGRGITREAAMSHVFGFTIINDVTARQLQRDHNQWFIGKSIDSFCPMGPWLVTRDELEPLSEIELRTFVNDEIRQRAKLRDLIFDIPTIIATLAQRTTLEPGDVIATGTPDGVGIGFKPPRFLQPRDRVRIEIDRLGALANPVG